MKIKWKFISGTGNRYAVSTTGEIVSYLVHKKGRHFLSNIPQRKLSLCNDKNGYKIVTLHFPEQGRKTVKIHRVVLETFIGPCPSGMECCHKDHNKANNNIANLSWDTHRNNQVRDGGAKMIIHKGQKNPMAKITERKVLAIRAAYATGKYKHKDIADRFGLKREHITKIVNRLRWTHI